MTTTPLPPDNSLPIVAGYKYRLKGTGTNWIEVIAVEAGKVTVRGIDYTIAEWTVPTWKFDDVVSTDYIESPA